MIDYGRLDRSVKHYLTRGYARIEVPWTVSRAVSNITKPADRADFEIVGKNKVLVGSAEQGFLYLYLKGFLPKGCFQAITPCFRDEAFDLSHTKYFMKNELIVTNKISAAKLNEVVNDAKAFFEHEAQRKVDLIKTADGWDIELNGYEIGSYGIRRTEFIEWIYGTGVAEPRMTMAMQKEQR